MATTDEKPVDTAAAEAPAKVETPAEPETEAPAPAEAPAEAPVEASSTDASAAPEESSLAAAQGDGSGAVGNGSELAEKEYKVEVKLADMQADPNNPLFSVHTFEELNLYVLRSHEKLCHMILTPLI